MEIFFLLLDIETDVENMNLGELLRNVRMERNLSIREVSKSIGISKSILSNYERNITVIPSDKLISLLTFYRIDPFLFLIKGREYVDITDYSEINKKKVLAIDYEENRKKII